MAIRIGTAMPELTGATEWLNEKADREQLKGKPTLVHFWAISCGVCSEQMPQIVKWREQMSSRGLQFVGIHMPRSERDTEVPRVREAAADYGLTHPVAVDNLHTVTDAFENKFVPAFYLFDAEGNLRHYSAGEHGITLLEKAIERVVTRSEEAATS